MGQQQGYSARVTAFYNCCQLHCMLGQQAVAVWLLSLSRDGPMEQVNCQRSRSETEKRRNGDRWRCGDLVLKCCSPPSKKLFQRCGRPECVIQFACVHVFTLFRSVGQILRVLLVNCCGRGRVCTGPTHMYLPTRTRSAECGDSPSQRNSVFMSFQQQET